MEIRTTRRRTRRQRPVKRAGRTVTVLAAFGMLATACSHSSAGPGVADASSSSSASGASTSSTSTPASPLAFAQCMRNHGIHDFPDPDSSGNFDLSGGTELNSSNPTYQAATEACSSLGSAGKASGPSLSPQQVAAVVSFAECMRSHGIHNYPDPDSSGRIPGIRHFGINPNSSQFQAANDACAHYISSIPGQEAP
jgi:hypothetical protein